MERTLNSEEEQLLALLRAHGALGNGKAREQLGWDEATYTMAKEGLYAQGLVAFGRGRGGSIRLAEPNGQLAAEPIGQTAVDLSATMPPPVPYPTIKRGRGRTGGRGRLKNYGRVVPMWKDWFTEADYANDELDRFPTGASFPGKASAVVVGACPRLIPSHRRATLGSRRVGLSAPRPHSSFLLACGLSASIRHAKCAITVLL